jgi:hypothetical protein
VTADDDPLAVLAAVVRCPEALDALVRATNGFVCPERLGSRLSYKLRFRTTSGRQKVIRLGPDPAKAAAVADALARVQRRARMLRELLHEIRLARLDLQPISRQLVAVLDEVPTPATQLTTISPEE